MNKKIFALVAIATTIAASFIFNNAANNREQERIRQKNERIEQAEKRAEQARRIMEEKRRKEEKERKERERRARRERTGAKKNKALEQIKNLENKYYNYLRMYGYAKGAYEQIQIQKELERILESINDIAIKEKLPNKRINNARAKARMDIARLYGH